MAALWAQNVMSLFLNALQFNMVEVKAVSNFRDFSLEPHHYQYTIEIYLVTEYPGMFFLQHIASIKPLAKNWLNCNESTVTKSKFQLKN